MSDTAPETGSESESTADVTTTAPDGTTVETEGAAPAADEAGESTDGDTASE